MSEQFDSTKFSFKILMRVLQTGGKIIKEEIDDSFEIFDINVYVKTRLCPRYGVMIKRSSSPPDLCHSTPVRKHLMK